MNSHSKGWLFRVFKKVYYNCDMDNIIPENEYTEVEGRVYSNPQIGIDETNTFIDNLRAAQGQQNQEIAQQTQRLGTDVPTILGGLTGADSYFTSRYQTPQTNANIANLRVTAQAKALNDVLANEQAIWKKRYQDAYRNYQKRQYNRAYGSGSGGGTATTTTGGAQGLEVDTNTGDTYDKTYVDTNTPTLGTPIPLTNTSMKYQDPKTGKWYVLTSPKELDAIAVTTSLAGRNPKDGMTTTANGKVFRYDAGTDMWYEQVYMFGQG